MSVCLNSAVNNSVAISARRSSKQRGTVLIMALLIVAVVAGLSIKFASDYQLGLTRAENRWHGLQARAYLSGVEGLAISFLKEDDPTVDYFGEGWDTEVPYEIDGGWLSGSLSDASSQLNLNSLGTQLNAEMPANNPERYSEAQRRFIRLLQCFPDLAITQDDAVAILEAIVDWMDPDDSDSGFGGAESFFYQSIDPPYLAANGPFMSMDELRLVRYMTPPLMAQLRIYVNVLPTLEPLNINTMPPLLLRVMNASNTLEPLNESDAQQLLQSPPQDGFYATVEDFKSNWDSTVGNGTLNTEGLATNTSYFMLRTQVSLVNQQRVMRSLLHRNGPEIRVVRRSDGY